MKISIKTIIYSIVAFYLILLGCQKPASQDPIINVNSTIQGLEVFLEISITDPEDQITELSVNWGDQTNGNTYSSDIHELNHYYSDPGTYDIKISAGDNNSVILTKNIKVDMDLKETSLDNIKPNLFKSSEKEILVLTINLHTYQESQQNEKFNLLVDVIGKMDVDFIALQECAQHKSAAIHQGIIREDNMALIISNRLKEKYEIDYNFVWNWAHYGWNVWEEGIAILSKHPLIDTDERYISSNTSVSNIQSRKVIYGSYQMDDGILNVFSAHTHWRTSTTDEQHNHQINNIKQIVVEKEALNMAIASFACGDFNVNPTSSYPWSEGYHTMMENGDYLDSFFEIYPDANNMPAQSIYNTIGGDYPGRIDYIFMKANTRYQVQESQIIFTGDVVGRLSDHYGVLTKLIDTE